MSDSIEGGENSTLTMDAPEFDEEVLVGMRDFWGVYERHYDEIRLVLVADLSADKEVGKLIRGTPPEIQEEQSRISRELSRRAIIEGEWEPYLANLKSQGSNYAHGGLSFAAWFRVFSSFRPHVVRHMLAAFGADSQRLVHAVDGMDRMLDLAMAVIGEAYIEAKEDIIARQREAIGELRSRARYQVILNSIADSVVVTDPHGNVMTINPAMERLSGVSSEEVIGERYDVAFPVYKDGRLLPWSERHLHIAIENLEVVSSQGQDLALRCKDGKEKPIMVTAAPVIEEGGHLLGGVNVFHELELPLS
jgi:PAS domain S-box-containing protein